MKILKKRKLSAIYNLARPYQYIKNIFVFFPAFFSFKISDVSLLYEAAIVFIAFSLVASAVYIFNDWKDRELDHSHPEKCSRPIASGQITTVAAFGFLVVFLTGGLILAIISSIDVFFIIGFYFILNVLYSFQLKHIPIIDVTIISAGFVLRLFAGAEATQVALSHWIIVITFLLALFLSLAKRRDDILIFIKTNQKTRKVIDGYNLKFLDAAMVMTAAIVVLAYILWSISPEVSARLLSENIFFTSIFVVLGILRYMQITFVEEKSGNPTMILIKDRFIQLTLICWIGSFLYLLYFN